MKRILTHALFLVMSPGLVYALGLGNIDLNSALNEPFDARIELLSSTAEELESLKVGLADSASFRRAGIDRPFILGQLKFAVRETENGPDYIRVYSTDPIREPFINFLLEASWSKGRLFREYTVLLDPPLYDPSRGMKVTTAPREMQKSTPSVISTPTDAMEGADASEGHVVVYGEDFSRQVTRPSISYTGDDYGPIRSLETLWSIASAMRPDDSISVNQLMLALLRTNPDAFINNNINGLKRGQIMRMPDASEINALTANEALAEAKSQHAMWDEIRGTMSAAVSERPAVSVAAESMPSEMTSKEGPGIVQEEIKSEAELRLVTQTGEGEGSDQVASDDMGAGTGATVAPEKLILAEESIAALTQENLEFKDRLQESEVLIDDLKRLVALKDDELVALQKQLAQSQVMEEEIAEVMPEAIEEVEEVMPAEEVAETEMAEEEEATADEIEEIAVDEEVAEADMAEEVEEEELAVDEEAEEATVAQPGASSGVMDIAGRYLGSVKNFVMGSQMIAMAGGGLLVVLILIAVLMKFRGRSAEPEAASLASEFPDFSEEDIGRTEPPASEAVTDTDESEAVTVIPESEVETEIADDATQVAMQPSDAEAPAEEEPEEDPMQEVNTYLAFEQFDQAEEFVRQALENEPDNPEFHVKLLEVFYTSGNKKSYEEAAQVLHDKVGGKGDSWSMAVAMWQEMSPNRALFDAPVAGEEEETTGAAGGGVVDITTDEETGDDAGLDFDLGTEDADKSEDDMLDLTVATDATEDQDDLLDVTAAVGLVEDEFAELMGESEADQMVDISGGPGEGQMLDITADEEEEVPDMTSGADEEGMLDITAAEEEGEMLDFTSGAEEEETEEPVGGEDDMLDLTAGGELDEDVLDISMDGSGEDLLDVTSSLKMQPDSDEDLLDVTAATSAGANSDDLLEINAEPEESSAAEDENAVEFDIGGLDMESDETDDDNVIAFDTAVSDKAEKDNEEGLDLDFDMGEGMDADEGGIELDLSDTSDEVDDLSIDIGKDEVEADEDEGLVFDLEGAGEDEADIESSGEISFDIGADEEESEAPEIDLSLDDGDLGSGSEDEADIESSQEMSFDIGAEESEVPEIDFSLDDVDLGSGSEDEANIESSGEMSFDIGAEESEVPEIDFSLDGEESGEVIGMDQTVEMPKINMDANKADDSDGEERTVFVPRTAQPEEQSVEDEIATKLDLAKAYVELGDEDSARTILDEVMAEGDDNQRQQAQELLEQI